MIRKLSSLAWVAALAFAMAGTALADPVETDDAGLPKFSNERSDRLDIYGAGMCHQCEWRPHNKVMGAAEQCGTGEDGAARLALFECGRNPACDPVCNFIRCETP